ncbi:MAG: ComEC/Rec2 family competence protein [Clostridiales bacterium]|nr:ComEC/Rec2 family competence protein [Clostridiales bacterium]
MRRRPLAFMCLAAALFLTLAGAVRAAGRKAALLTAQEYLSDMADTKDTLILEGSVSEVYAVSDGVRLFVNQISIVKSGGLAGALSPKLKLMMTVGTDTYLPGDLIRVSGSWKPFTEAGNPGQFDTQEYYFAKNTLGSISGPTMTLLSEGSWSLLRMLSGIRRVLRASYLRILEEKEARTVSAISLGEKSFMEQEWKQLYQEGGIAHIISISGLHISLIGMCIYKLLRRVRLPFLLAALPSAMFVILYALMSGFGISATRACLMFILWLGSQIAGRKNDMLTSTAIAAVLILAGNPFAAMQSSFLLSFGAILSIALLVPALTDANPFREWARRKNVRHVCSEQDSRNVQNVCDGRDLRKIQDVWNERDVRRAKNARNTRNAENAQRMQSVRNVAGKKTESRLCKVCAAGDFLWRTGGGGLGIWIGALPITLWFFYQTSPWSILVNLAVIPLMSALMASALLSCLAGLLSVPLGTFLAAPVYYLLGFFEWLCTLEQKLPGAIWIAGRPAIWKVMAYYVLLIGTAMAAITIRKAQSRQKRMRQAQARQSVRLPRCTPAILWMLTLAVCVGLMGFHPHNALTVTCLDVGQGDGALIQLPDGTNCLIDGGSTSVSSLWEYRISQTVKYYGISSLDYIFLSHADSDHVSGIEEYLEDYLSGFAGRNAHGISLKNLVLPPTEDESDFEALTERCRELGITVLRMEEGAVLGNAVSSLVSGQSAESSQAATVSSSAAADSWSLTCMAPSSDSLSGDKNEDSMVLLLQYGNFRMLFTGDLEGDAELALAASGADLTCDVLKVGHHGSKGASSEAFLAAASPAFGIISCGANNTYGHPATAAVERLEAADVTLYATMDCGAMTVRSDGTSYRIFGHLKTEAYVNQK